MCNRKFLAATLLIGLVVPLTSCGNPSGLDSIQVSPTAQTLTVGQTLQFTATGTYGNANHEHTQDVTTQVTWTSSTPAVATVSASGLATAVSSGTTTITASATGFAGPVTSSAIIAVTSTGGGGPVGGSIVSIAIIPGTQAVSAVGDTAQFLAIGTTSSGATQNLTNVVTWSSSSTQIATVGATTGIATAVGQGTATITALYSSSNGTTVTGVATFSVSAGSTQQVTALTLIPGSETLSASGQTGQLIALGTSGSTGLLNDVSSSAQLTWTSNIPSIATVSPTGLATGVSPGTATITAIWTNSDQTVVTGNVTITVSSTPPPEPLLSLTIIPASISVGNLQDTGQFLAIGTFSTAPYVQDLTNTVKWLSSAPNVFPVSSNNSNAQGQENAGVASAWGNGSATIIAEAIATDGSVQTATATFACPLTLPNPLGDPPTPGSCFPGSQASALLSTLTVYNMGLNTTDWELTAPSATGTANVLHCGPGWTVNGGAGGSVCTATYPVGTVVTITAPAGAGAFGGWSQNCTPTAPITAAGPNSCTVSLSSDDTVGAIFN
jgi:uncharacterized protein YjdB